MGPKNIKFDLESIALSQIWGEATIAGCIPIKLTYEGDLEDSITITGVDTFEI